MTQIPVEQTVKIGTRYFNAEQLIKEIIEIRQIPEYQEEEIDFGEEQ